MSLIKMGELFVKICGVTILDDALSAVECGADAIGFNFYRQSKRYISPDRAAEIIDRLPGDSMRVGVFVNPDREYVNAAIESSGISGLQFSGNELPEARVGLSSTGDKSYSCGKCGVYPWDEVVRRYYFFAGHIPRR